MNRGAVVVGYPGIGKSTLADQDLHFIDLESGNFWVGGKRAYDWYIPYCQIAVNLASQGYVVFVSSHKEVRNQLLSMPLLIGVHLCCCVPCETLKNFWIAKLQHRFLESGLDKDYKAWKNALDRYTENIQEIKRDFDVVCEINSADYNLSKLLQSVFQQNNWGIYF